MSPKIAQGVSSILHAPIHDDPALYQQDMLHQLIHGQICTYLTFFLSIRNQLFDQLEIIPFRIKKVGLLFFSELGSVQRRLICMI